jgi:hypothetical protein
MRVKKPHKAKQIKNKKECRDIPGEFINFPNLRQWTYAK